MVHEGLQFSVRRIMGANLLSLSTECCVPVWIKLESCFQLCCFELSLSTSNMHHLQHDWFRDSISLCWHLQQQASRTLLQASRGVGEIVSFLASGLVSACSDISIEENIFFLLLLLSFPELNPLVLVFIRDLVSDSL